MDSIERFEDLKETFTNFKRRKCKGLGEWQRLLSPFLFGPTLNFSYFLTLISYKITYTLFMITVISGTNRKGSECLQFARKCVELLEAKTEEPIRLLALEDIPHDWFFPEMYVKGMQAPSLSAIQDEFMIPASKFVYVISEYNGGVPGALKVFLDGCSVRAYKETFKNKKAALVGVASGRAGNLRGMDHLTSVLHHVGTIVMPNKLPISRIEDLMDVKGNITDLATIKVLDKQMAELLAF